MDLDVAVNDVTAVIDVRRPTRRTGVRAACLLGQILRRLSLTRDPDPDPVDIVRGYFAHARLAAVLDLDTERHRDRPLAVGRVVVSHTAEAGHVRRRRTRLGARLAIARVAQLPVEHPVTSTHQAVVILRVEAPLAGLARVLPVALDVV